MSFWIPNMAVGLMTADPFQAKADAELFRHFHAMEVEAETQRKRRTRATNLLGRSALLLAFFAGWWLLAAFYPPVLVASPGDTWRAFLGDSETIWENTPITLLEIVLGFLSGSALGIALGTLIAQSRWAEVIITPYLVVSQAVPKVALAPILILFLGYGIGSKVAVAALIAFFPLLENTILGLRRVDPDSLRLLRSLGATKLQVFLKLRLFSALPLVFAGLRIAAVLATLGTIVGEFVAGNKGLGALLVISMSTFSTPLMYATMVILTALAFAVYVLVEWFERQALRRYNLASPGN